jgi:phosphoglycerol transferase MdoB-like AlkP superfamily enzyme
MTNKKPISPIEDSVMSRIRSGEVRMHPKIYFVVLGVIGTLSVVFAGLVNAYFMSVISLWMRLQIAQGQAYGLRRNLEAVLGSFPWIALIFAILSIAIAVYIIRKAGWIYKISLAKLIWIAVVLSLLVGFALSYSSLPNALNRRNAACVTCIEHNSKELDKIFYKK